MKFYVYKDISIGIVFVCPFFPFLCLFLQKKEENNFYNFLIKLKKISLQNS